jgi:probable phosphoglycerate mutase
VKLHLIRHGETVTSGKTYAGRSDVALTLQGREQAETIAAELAGCPIERIVTSPLARAVETAAPLAARLGLVPVIDPALQEIDFGNYEGLAKTTLGLKLRTSHARMPIPGGESLLDVWDRAGEVFARLQAENLAEVAIVGHFWINRMIAGRIRGLGFDETCRSRAYRPATGSVALMEWRSGATGSPWSAA